MPAGTPVGGAPAGVPAEGPALTIKFGAACGVRCGSGYLSTLICKPQGPLLAGNIVQVRLERKALSAAVSPTCCSGPAEHALRSDLAASAVTRLPAFKAGARVAVYLPFDRETDTAALLAAARRR